jgi:hypothetical protein
MRNLKEGATIARESYEVAIAAFHKVEAFSLASRKGAPLRLGQLHPAHCGCSMSRHFAGWMSVTT